MHKVKQFEGPWARGTSPVWSPVRDTSGPPLPSPPPWGSCAVWGPPLQRVCFLGDQPLTSYLNESSQQSSKAGSLLAMNRLNKWALARLETSQGHLARSGWAGIQTQGSSWLLRGTSSCSQPPGTWAAPAVYLTPIQAVEQVADRVWVLVCASVKWGDSTPLTGQGQEWMRGDGRMCLKSAPHLLPRVGGILH